MLKNLFRQGILFLFLSVSTLLPGQPYRATLVKEDGLYKAYVSTELQEPLYVVYELYKGGGGCNRTENGYDFVNDPNYVGTSDYKGSGFDKGHLANAEDFGTKCENTFRYFNCLPQKPTLNRGIWKSYETKIRKLSQKKHLLILCGGTFMDAKKKGNLTVPKEFWKIVIDEETNDIVYCLIFPNDASKKVSNISQTELRKKLGYTLKFD